MKVSNDLLLTADRGNCSVLVLLDLSAAFDTIDHSVLLHRLSWIGLKRTALQLLRSHLTNRTVSVVVEKACSSVAYCNCGVPQGSILGPLLFSIYLLPLSQIIQNHGVSHHCFSSVQKI